MVYKYSEVEKLMKNDSQYYLRIVLSKCIGDFSDLRNEDINRAYNEPFPRQKNTLIKHIPITFKNQYNIYTYFSQKIHYPNVFH